MAILAEIGLTSRQPATKIGLFRINRIILVPAWFLLAAGIFVGAVWVNQSRGSYWDRDPNETCALIMLLIYSVPVHRDSKRLRIFRNPKVFQCYLLCAVVSAMFTYFGSHYLLPGLHSYA